MILLNCYYQLKEHVVRISSRVTVNRKCAYLIGEECTQAVEAMSNDAILFEGYKTIGKPFPMPLEELDAAVNLNTKCLNCIYCHKTSCELSCGEKKSSAIEAIKLYCELRSGFRLPTGNSVLAINCAYQAKSIPQIRSTVPPKSFDLKDVIRKAVSAASGSITCDKFIMLPPDMFMRIVSLLKDNDIIYLGSGESAGEFGPIMHESLEDYLNFESEDADTICIKAEDVSRGGYAYLQSELSPTPRCAIAVPALNLMCYCDDITVGLGQNYGFVMHAPKEIIQTLMA